ncbi:sugar O-acetyltransferase [Oxalobacteraceae bacterium R-40]|uniref:Sugar O-acetyltransferase n=1 Tax=Keguizhuia sedimenti TaxID=3064264 RepID=A0ABU1BJW9_9BURK|nr:sugar O-acetyltransferase [Oxalobacteraceae bacterium R-40]
MKTEKEKMLAGELYDPMDAQLLAERGRARTLLKLLNDSDPSAKEKRAGILHGLFGVQSDVFIEPPFYCDYGTNIRFGTNVFMNFNCVVLDVAAVTIGDFVLCGPNVQIYTASHPMDAALRRRGLECGAPVTIAADVWIGGGVIICPGVTIGPGSVIGAGSVVTRSVPEGVFAAGNPCRVIRPISLFA